MIRKKDLSLIKRTKRRDFYSIEIVQYVVKGCDLDILFELRSMSKHLSLEYQKIEIIQKEHEIRQKVRHPFLLNYVYCFQDSERLFLVTEYSRGLTLKTILNNVKTISKNTALFYFAEILVTLQYLHKRNINFRLLLPENIEIAKTGHIKLRFDFLNSKGFTYRELLDNLFYISVDYFRYNLSDHVSDYWCLGVLLFEMIYGYNPYQYHATEEKTETLKDKIKSMLNWEYKAVNSDLVNNLIENLTNHKRFRRLGFKKKQNVTVWCHPS